MTAAVSVPPDSLSNGPTGGLFCHPAVVAKHANKTVALVNLTRPKCVLESTPNNSSLTEIHNQLVQEEVRPMDNELNNESPNEIMAEAPKRENPVAKNKQDIMAEIPPDSGSAKIAIKHQVQNVDQQDQLY